MTTLSAHVLDATLGQPAGGLHLTVNAADGTTASATTDAGGRVRLDDEIAAGVTTLTFETGAWFSAQDREAFHPRIDVTFTAAEGEHHHIAVLVSPYSYTTYRGS